MGNSLFEQLQKSGLVDEKKAKQAKKEKHRQAKQRKGKQAGPSDEGKLRVQQVQAEKAARDRELNRQHKEAADRKAIAAQIEQLVELNRVGTDDGEVGFNFADEGKVRRIYVTAVLRDELLEGRLAIVKLKGGYELVPAGVAEKIALRDPSRVVVHNAARPGDDDGDDPYAAYQVPDDLTW